MERLFTPGIQCTDPDQLQFCLHLSDTEFWYCEPNHYHTDLFPGADTPARRIYDKYRGYPDKLLQDARQDTEVMAFVTDRRLWITGTIDAADFSREEQEALLKDYGYAWENFTSDADRNQIICENHFEQYPHDYRDDI